MSLILGQMALSITFTHDPPMLAWTPYQILNTGPINNGSHDYRKKGSPCHGCSIEYAP